MKRLNLIIALVFAITSFVFVDSALAGRVGKRQIRQQKRICQGVKSGELTGKEAGRLECEQARVRHAKRKAWSDGELTAKERIRLEKKQDRASRHIYRAKHNDSSRQDNL